MKINETIGLRNRAQNLQAKKKESRPFTSVMDAVQAKMESSQFQPEKSFSITPLLCTEQYAKGFESKQILEHASTLLDLMENYAKALGDPKKSLKSIEPIVRQIDMQSKDLENASEEMDHELAKVIQEISTTAKTATMKFDRGDYI